MKIWGVCGITSLLPLLPDPLWPGMVVSISALSMNQIDQWTNY